ncbi:MAG: hypothetical protein HZC36_08280 [Armatimonadetes bacterium]|nr:hypothetical protein [Armatimonadota bacterium]
MTGEQHLASIGTFGDVRFWALAVPAALLCLLSAVLQRSPKSEKKEVLMVLYVLSLIFGIGLVIGAFFSLGVAGGIGAAVLSFFVYGLGMGWAR